ncbi:hypothetical protein ACTNDZ_00715 [Selenomonas montiformis]|uniref:hypothetical protein n=1 Tax=Selenomonas montiformis TaxID=2652285 RepID=UPI003F8B887D
MSEEIIRYEGDTTTRELWDGGATVSTGVSRKLSPKNRSFSMVVFQQAKPILDSEVNLAQQIQNHLRADYIRQTLSDGFLKLKPSYGVTNVKNCIRLNEAVANMQGWIIQMSGANRNDAKSDIVFPAAPNSGTRDDLAYVEIFFEPVAPTGSREDDDENVYKYGGLKSGTLTNDLLDEVAGAETSRRVQLRWNIRTVSDVNFTTYPDGVNDSSRVKARGGAVSDSDYSYAKIADGVYRAGDGSNAACVAMNCIDGYVYALPLYKVRRRNQTAYNADDNPHGAPGYGTSGAPQRPDGLFHDVIAPEDVVLIYPVAATYKNATDEATESLTQKEILCQLGQANSELETWKNQRVQQGTVMIYNKFVAFGGVINAIAGTRNVKITKTGTYNAANYSVFYLDGQMVSIADTQDSVAAVPTNPGDAAVSYYAYVEKVGNNYTVKVGEEVPEGLLGLYRITVPAGDTAANLNSATFSDIRRVESRYRGAYGKTPATTVTLPYAAVGTNYSVTLDIEATTNSRETKLRVTDKRNYGFTIQSVGEADNICVRWTMVQAKA